MVKKFQIKLSFDDIDSDPEIKNFYNFIKTCEYINMANIGLNVENDNDYNSLLQTLDSIFLLFLALAFFSIVNVVLIHIHIHIVVVIRVSAPQKIQNRICDQEINFYSIYNCPMGKVNAN